MLDLVLQFYGDGVQDVPFFFTNNEGEQERSVIRSPLSRELQDSTVQCYKERILRESISQVAAGHLIALSLKFKAIKLYIFRSIFKNTLSQA